jgi:DNA polymerase V
MNSILKSISPLPASHTPMPVNLIRGEVKAGFPSPAEDLGSEHLDLANLIGSDKEDAFFMRASGHSMIDGDLMLVRKRKRPRDGHIVIADIDGEFLVKMLYKQSGVVKLVSGNPDPPDIEPTEDQTIKVWGVVTHSIKTFGA